MTETNKLNGEAEIEKAPLSVAEVDAALDIVAINGAEIERALMSTMPDTAVTVMAYYLATVFAQTGEAMFDRFTELLCAFVPIQRTLVADLQRDEPAEAARIQNIGLAVFSPRLRVSGSIN